MSEWINVKNRLPNIGIEVLAICQNKYIDVLWIGQYPFEGWTDGEYYNLNVTHWIPLPQPPKEEK